MASDGPASDRHPAAEGAGAGVLAPGTHIDRYVVAEKIGQGGIGASAQSRRPAPRAARRAEGDVAKSGRGSRQAPLLPRSQGRVGPQSSEHRHDLRDRLGAGRGLHCDGVRRGRHAGARAHAGHAAARDAIQLRPPDRQRALQGARGRRRPPRFEAGQRDGHAARRPQDSRLRPGQAPRRGAAGSGNSDAVHRAHPARPRHGNTRVHVSGAGPGCAGEHAV